MRHTAQALPAKRDSTFGTNAVALRRASGTGHAWPLRSIITAVSTLQLDPIVNLRTHFGEG